MTDMPLDAATHAPTGTSLSARIERWRLALSAPVSAQSLAVLRMLFGGILVWDCWRYIENTRIIRYYVLPDHNFPYFGLDFIRPLPEPFIHWAWLGVGLTAFLVMIGLWYRVAIWGFVLLFGYFFLLDRTQYLNHNYLVLLYAVLLALAPANRMWSVDAWLNPGWRSEAVPAWTVGAVRLQTEIVLIYAGIVKITDDWLRGEPLKMWIEARQGDLWLADLFQYDWMFLAATWGTVILHVAGAPLLYWHRTRLAVFLIYCCFHVSNAMFFNIGIFPWLTMAVTLIFFAPDWPQRLARGLLGLMQPLPPAPALPPMRVPPLSRALMAVMAVWFAVQIVVPQRQLFFPNLVGWTGDGHRFSWRMRIYDRDAEGYFRVVAPSGEEWRINPREVMSSRQAQPILTRTDLIHDYAQVLEAEFAARGHGDVAVYAHIMKSLNGRPAQPYIDTSVDLTSVPYNWFGPDPWVVPIQTRVREGELPDWFPPLPLQKP